MNKLEVIKLSKRYSNKLALDNISCTFKPGIYGLVGPNGAGKSTLINIIATIMQQTSGKVLFNNQAIYDLKASYRALLGIMPQSQKGYDNFTAYQFLLYMASLKGLNKKSAIKEIDHLVNIVGLHDDINNKVKTYSGGMRQRLMLAQALIGDPEIIILDEPTAGLDPFERISIRNYISEFSKNKIVIIATHIMQDIESIADDILLIKEGKITFDGQVSQALDAIRGKVFSCEIDEKELPALKDKYRISNISKTQTGLAIRFISEENIEWAKLETTVNLEEVYLYFLV